MKAKNPARLAVALMGVSGVSLSNPITYDLSFANGSSTLTVNQHRWLDRCYWTGTQRVTYFGKIQ